MTNIVRMACGDELRFDIAPPRVGEIIWCQLHESEQRVVKSPLASLGYRGKCQNCVYGTRNVDINMLIRRIKRHINNNGHSVRIFDAYEIRKVLTTVNPKNVTGVEQLEIFSEKVLQSLTENDRRV